MTAVDIPDQAMDVAWRTFAAHWADDDDDQVAALADAITAAAPIVVAAELRRLAEERLNRSAIHSIWQWLIDRADELDPPGGAS